MLHAYLALLLASSVAPPPPDDDDKPPAHGAKAAPNAPAVEDDDEGKAVPATQVVVTGRRLDVARTQIDPSLGSTVYTLGNDAIEDRPGGETASMAVTLTQTPGVSLLGDALTIRGSKDIQVRINGVIVPEAIADPADHLSIRLAQSTRVMTGTLPAQYGFVPAGVISVTTKSGLYRHGGEVELYAGSDGFIEPAIEWAGSVLGTSIFGSGSFENRKMEIADASGTRTHDRSHEAEGLLFADHIIGAEDRVSFIVGGSRERHQLGATSLPAGTEESGDGYGVATFQHSGEDFTVQASLFVGEGTSEATFLQRTLERRSSLGTQVDASYSIGRSHTLRAGMLAGHRALNELPRSAAELVDHRDSIGVYVQDEWKLGPAVTFNPGVRIDWLRGFNAHEDIEPRASLVWTASDELTAHAGYARYASTAELGDETRSETLPNERDDYLDAGLQYRAGALTLGADAYLRKTSNLLLEHQTVGTAYLDAFAFKSARFRGLELSANYATHSLSAWLNASLARGRGRTLIDPAALFASAAVEATAGKWAILSSDRPVTGSAGLTWRSGKLALSGTVLASSGTVRSPTISAPNGGRDHAYATIGLSAVYHAGLGGRLSDFRLDLTNLANARYRLADATSLEGGWTRWGQERALTVGIEQGF